MSKKHLTFGALHQEYAAGVSAYDMMAKVYARIEAVDDPGIFIHIADRAALTTQADALGDFDPESKPLWGVPFAVKDNIDVAGMPTTAGSPTFAYTADEDAEVVHRLRAAGAIVIGKTNLDQFATGLVGTRTPYPIPKNALDTALIPGGSSSGSAIAVAQGIVAFALGTDTAGSGRIPAGLNGIVGLKPSLGALSTRGVVPACRTLDCVSIFAPSIADAKRVFAVACAYDKQDPYSRPWTDGNTTPTGHRVRIGVPKPVDRRFFEDAAARTAYEESLSRLSADHAELIEIPFQPFYDVAELLYEGPWVAERYAAIKDFIENNEGDLHPVTRAIITKAGNFSAVEAFLGIYRLRALKQQTETLMEDLDMLCVPTAPTWYTVVENLADPLGTNSKLGTYTNFVNLLGLCALTVPTGRQSDGRPASVTFLARDGKDALIAKFAENFVGDTTTASSDPASRFPKQERPDDVEIAVVGAHLSGLPLNHELTDLGASFRRATRTNQDYRLFELGGATPRKPGLLRVPDETGCAIEVEIWSLTPEAFGRFVSRIPAPLGIGTIRLNDGATVKGFVVESEGVTDARDISTFGGWRNFVTSEDAVA